jgi:hypothetical protein
MDAAKDRASAEEQKQGISIENAGIKSSDPMAKGAQNMSLAEAIAQQKPSPWTRNMFMVSVILSPETVVMLNSAYSCTIVSLLQHSIHVSMVTTAP